mgnify:CR=1 FL=1
MYIFQVSMWQRESLEFFQSKTFAKCITLIEVRSYYSIQYGMEITTNKKMKKKKHEIALRKIFSYFNTHLHFV